jgi:hypothetical protein
VGVCSGVWGLSSEEAVDGRDEPMEMYDVETLAEWYGLSIGFEPLCDDFCTLLEVFGLW